MKKLYLLLLLSTACGRIGVDILPVDDASTSTDGGKVSKVINTRENVPDSGTNNDASTENDASATDASVRDGGIGEASILLDGGATIGEAGVSTPDAVVDTFLNGNWIVQLDRTGGTCTDAVVTYEDLWTIENESDLHSVDYDLMAKNGVFVATYVNAKVAVTVQNMNGTLTGTHRLDALNLNGTVRCYVSRSVRGVRD